MGRNLMLHGWLVVKLRHGKDQIPVALGRT
jgi:hypothetical protein